jgi:hypothetical protein
MVRKLVLLVVAGILTIGLLPGVVMGAPPVFTAGAAGIGDPYYPDDGNGGYDVGHYALDVRYEPDTDVLTGVATITATATQNLSAFNLDFDGLTVRSVTVNGVAARIRRVKGELTVTPRSGIPTGASFTTVIRYDGVPQTLEDFGMSGFIHTDDGAIVIGEPHVASTWFPANDHPRDKASFRIRITVPAGIEAISNGVLLSQSTAGPWSTWTWDAVEPMTTYLAMMAIGQFDVRSYQQAKIKYWDAIDSRFMEDAAPAVTPRSGRRFLDSQVGEPAYKRLTRTLSVPPGGATVGFQVNRDTEPGWDFFFVESRTPGGDDWSTLPDVNGHTSQDVGACPFFKFANPFLDHYLTTIVLDPGDPNDPFDDVATCDPVGSTGAWHAASGASDGWEPWSVELANPTAATTQVEVSLTYASDEFVQLRGVSIDDIVTSTGEGSTGFEAGQGLAGWSAPSAGPDGSADNPNTWGVTDFVPGLPGLGASVLVSFDRQPEIIGWQANTFGKYPFSAGGGVVDEAPVFFALENQTRPTYSPFFFGGPEGNDFVVVHELAHQWFGDSLAVDAWQHIWLNEGFATYAEWLWSEREGFDTAQQIFDFHREIPEDDPFWALPIGDPGPDALFFGPVYSRGALTLHALRVAVGDQAFFRILKAWASSQANGTVTTAEFIATAEQVSGQQLDALFDEWLSAGRPPSFGPPAALRQATATGLPSDMPAAIKSLAARLKYRPGNPYRAH